LLKNALDKKCYSLSLSLSWKPVAHVARPLSGSYSRAEIPHRNQYKHWKHTRKAGKTLALFSL
jgi:hypothetical protein